MAMNDKPIKLNLGSGNKPLAGYVNLDGKAGHGIYPLCWRYQLGEHAVTLPKEVDEIRASHVLEHFPYSQTERIIAQWTSRLKPGGVLKIAVPDFTAICKAYLDKRDVPVEGYVLGGQTDEYDYHKAIFDEPALRQMMAAAGLEDIQPWVSEIDDCAALPISLNLMGVKPPAAEAPGSVSGDMDSGLRITVHESRAQTYEPRATVPPRIAMVMSLPRLMFTENVACLNRTIAALGIPCHAGTGVFWGQVLTRQIEDRLADGFDYVLAVDYDSWFLPDHVRALAALLTAHPEADAVCAVQCRREDSLPIMAIHDADGQPLQIMPRSMFAGPLTQIHIAHFGLTLFRASCFARLAKPWFRPVPDPNGSWREGRSDDDVTFWRNFEAAGCRVYMANDVSIGHLQQICTFPGPAADNWRPVHVYLKDLNAGRVPDHCNPDLERIPHGSGT
jgi:predicted SAM-dependent methyltransferase